MAYPLKHPDSLLTAALRAFDGNVNAAARSLRYGAKNLAARVRRNPALWPEGVPRRRPGGFCRVSDDAVRAALVASVGNQTQAAKLVGMSQQGLNARLNARR